MINEKRRDDIIAFLKTLSIDHQLVDLELIHLSLVHRSWNVEHGLEGDNERLEFLGDAVIGMHTTVYLYDNMPDESEGELSKIRATMVSRKVLGEIALGMNIGDLLLLGAGEQSSGGNRRLSTLGSALEAFCGGLYQSPDFQNIDEFLRRVVIHPAWALAQRRVMKDYKSLLQEYSQGSNGVLPDYRMISEEGPDHEKKFRVGVFINGEKLGEGSGGRKKNAENDAARFALESIAKNEQ